MLYETLSQPKVFFIIISFGFLFGLFCEIFTFIFKNYIKNNIFCHFFQFFLVFLLILNYFFINLFFNYGEYRTFSALSYLSSFLIERFLFRYFLAIPISKCYNKIKGKYYEKNKSKHI